MGSSQIKALCPKLRSPLPLHLLDGFETIGKIFLTFWQNPFLHETKSLGYEDKDSSMCRAWASCTRTTWTTRKSSSSAMPGDSSVTALGTSAFIRRHVVEDWWPGQHYYIWRWSEKQNRILPCQYREPKDEDLSRFWPWQGTGLISDAGSR